MKPMKSILGLVMAVSLSLAATCATAAEDLTVSAAASLKPSFLAIGKRFESENPDIKLKFNFASTPQLASQVEQGAPVDVFAAADTKTLMDLVGKGRIQTHSVLARNSLTAVFFKSKAPAKPTLEDLIRPGVKLIMPSSKIPAAIYINDFLAKADAAGVAQGQFGSLVRRNTVSEEPDIRMVATKISMGAADAGVVYKTDVTDDIKDKVVQVAIPTEWNSRADYTIGVLGATKKKDLAKRFYDFVLSAKGQAVMIEFGFLPAL